MLEVEAILDQRGDERLFMLCFLLMLHVHVKTQWTQNKFQIYLVNEILRVKGYGL